MNITRMLLVATLCCLPACKSVNSIHANEWHTADFSIVCLNGIEYWMRSIGYLAVKINPVTDLPSHCTHDSP